MTKMLQWDEVYCFQKFLPVLTRWQLFHFADTERCRQIQSLLGSVLPVCIKKKRSPKGVASYEIIWKDNDNCFEGLIPEEQLTKFLGSKYFIFRKTVSITLIILIAENKNDNFLLWSTIEPADLVQSAYPDLVERFLEGKATKLKKKPTSRKQPVDGAKNSRSSQPKTRKQNSQPKPITPVLINRFLHRINSRRKPIPPKCVASPKIATSSEPMDLSMFAFSLDDSTWSKIDEDSPDLSAVINGIVEQQPPVMEFCGRRLRFEIIDSMDLENEKENCAIETGNLDNHEIRLNANNVIYSNQKLVNTVSNNLIMPLEQLVHNESLDQFDRLVMGTGFQTSNMIDHSSTPVSQKLYSNPCTLSPVISNQPNSVIPSTTPRSPENDDPNVSHFYELNMSADTDQFEKSIDYRNMPDEIPAVDRPVIKQIRQSVVSQVMPKNDTHEDSFNLNGYVPIGKKLRKQLSS